MSGASETPICVAIVLCNEYIEDKRTNNKTLVNLFNAITVPSVPAVHNRLVIMASVTNASTVLPLYLIIRAPSGTEVARVNFDFPAGHPLTVYDMVFEINGITLPEVGTYNIDLQNGASYLGGRRFDVVMSQN